MWRDCLIDNQRSGLASCSGPELAVFNKVDRLYHLQRVVDLIVFETVCASRIAFNSVPSFAPAFWFHEVSTGNNANHKFLIQSGRLETLRPRW